MRVNSARRREAAGPSCPPAGSRPWQRELFKSMMLAPPSTQQPGEAAPAMHAAGRRRPGTWIRPAGQPARRPPPTGSAAGGGRQGAQQQQQKKTASGARQAQAAAAYVLSSDPPAPIDHPPRVAAVNWRPAAAPAAAAFALLPALFGSGGHGESSRGWPASWLPITSSRPARSSMDRLGLLRIGSSFEFDHIMETKP